MHPDGDQIVIRPAIVVRNHVDHVLSHDAEFAFNRRCQLPWIDYGLDNDGDRGDRGDDHTDHEGDEPSVGIQ